MEGKGAAERRRLIEYYAVNLCNWVLMGQGVSDRCILYA